MPLAPTIGTQLTTPAFDFLTEKARYRVQIFAFADSDTFGVGSLIADLDKFSNLGYADSINGVPNAFFTMEQADPNTALLSNYLDSGCHVRILRNERIVWSGWLLESDEQPDDVVFYAYGYLAGLYWILSAWKDEHNSEAVSTIVNALWKRANSDLTQSLLGFVSTGTIEGAQSSSAGAGEVVLPYYPLYYKRILFALQELAALGMSDTTNTVVFEITHDENPVFNFWHNRGIDRDDIPLTWDQEIMGFSRARTPVFDRNDVKAVGSLAFDTLLRKDDTNSASIFKKGRRQEPLFLAWVRDEDEVNRVLAFRTHRADREDTMLNLRLKSNAVLPPGAVGAFELGDRLPVRIDHGATVIDDHLMVSGYQVVYQGEERMNLLVQDHRAGVARPLGLKRTVADNAGQYLAFPGLTRMDDGRLLAVYYYASDAHSTEDGVMKGQISANNGLTWGTAFTIFEDAGNDIRAGEVTTLANGDILAVYVSGLVSTGYTSYVIKSTDNGATWGTPVEITGGPTFRHVNQVCRIVELPNGDLLCPMDGEDASGDDRRIVVVRSTDGGATWGDQVNIADATVGSSFSEPQVGFLQDGRLMCLTREDTGDTIHVSYSSDQGATWTTPASAFDGGSKAAWVQLQSGTILTVYRPNSLDSTVYRLSTDLGATWTAETIMDPIVCEYASLVPTRGDGAYCVYAIQNSTTNADIRFDEFIDG